VSSGAPTLQNERGDFGLLMQGVGKRYREGKKGIRGKRGKR
jgi:hypothetical protein